MAQETFERHGEAFELGEQLTVVGRKLEVDDAAPDVPLEMLDSSTGAVRTVQPSDWPNKVRLLNIVNSRLRRAPQRVEIDSRLGSSLSDPNIALGAVAQGF